MGHQTKPLQERDHNANAAANPSHEKESTKKSTDQKLSASKKKQQPQPAADLSNTHLDGEETESVPIFETCDDVRRKINNHLKHTTRAAFSRELNEMLPSYDVTPRHMANFLKMKGPRAGGHNPVFYAGYVYFEKLRVRENKKKSVKRQKMEEAWASEGGIPREGSHNMHFICHAGQGFRIGQYGVIQSTGQAKRGPSHARR